MAEANEVYPEVARRLRHTTKPSVFMVPGGGFDSYDEDLDDRVKLVTLVRRADSVTDAALAWYDEQIVPLGDERPPVFLFVHTFRTHAPYEVSEATREAYREVLDIEGEYTELEARLKQLVGGIQELDFSGAEASALGRDRDGRDSITSAMCGENSWWWIQATMSALSKMYSNSSCTYR